MKVISNAVNGEILHTVYEDTLNDLANCLRKSFGPYGSRTLIQLNAGVHPTYTKDGHTILSALKYSSIIEASIASNVQDITGYIARTVGDGTTSAVMLSDMILKKLVEYQNNHPEIPPIVINREFSKTVKLITNEIEKRGRDFTSEDAYHISMIATNSDEDISKEIKNIYDTLGKNAYISINVAHNTEDMVNIYDGLVLESGVTEEAFLNDPIQKKCIIDKPRIYAFKDPIDTMEMASYLDTILNHNIINPMKDNSGEYIPTVIIAPKISRDCSPLMENIVRALSKFNGSNIKYRPPVLFITNLAGVDVDMYDDISKMCGCKYIQKYINPDLMIADQEKGLAPTLENVFDFFGMCDRIESDTNKTSFIRPFEMIKEYDDNNEPVYTENYTNLVAFLENELVKAKSEDHDLTEIHNLKKRINSLKSSFVEWFVGGLAAADRDNRKAAIEDAVMNCRSAANYGVGYGANFEGLRAADKIHNDIMTFVINDKNNSILENMSYIIYESYASIIETLYNKKGIATELLANGKPTNILNPELPVLSSIESDKLVLEAMDKIISTMATSNQYICPEPQDGLKYFAEAEKMKNSK